MHDDDDESSHHHHESAQQRQHDLRETGSSHDEFCRDSVLILLIQARGDTPKLSVFFCTKKCKFLWGQAPPSRAKRHHDNMSPTMCPGHGKLPASRSFHFCLMPSGQLRGANGAACIMQLPLCSLFTTPPPLGSGSIIGIILAVMSGESGDIVTRRCARADNFYSIAPAFGELSHILDHRHHARHLPSDRTTAPAATISCSDLRIQQPLVACHIARRYPVARSVGTCEKTEDMRGHRAS